MHLIKSFLFEITDRHFDYISLYKLTVFVPTIRAYTRISLYHIFPVLIMKILYKMKITKPMIETLSFRIIK